MPRWLRATVRRVETPLGTLYVTITEDGQGQPFEVFMTLGKAGVALMADVGPASTASVRRPPNSWLLRPKRPAVSLMR